MARFPVPAAARLAPAALALVLAPILSGCDSSRPPVPKNPLARHYAREEGRALILRAVEAHGGLARWQRKQDVRFHLEDTWKGVAGSLLRPWPGDSSSGVFSGLLGRGMGRIEVDSERGKMTYAVGPDGPWAQLSGRASYEEEDIETAASVVPAYLFYFQMPFSFLSYDAVAHYIGVKPAPPGGPVHEVLVTYPWYEGEVASDWYVARFDTSTMLLRSVTYTSNRWGPSAFEYTDELGAYIEVDSLRIPTRHVVRMSRPFRPNLHRWQVSDVRFNQGLTDSTFRGPAGLASR